VAVSDYQLQSCTVQTRHSWHPISISSSSVDKRYAKTATLQQNHEED
jgi:hypothetical protein